MNFYVKDTTSKGRELQVQELDKLSGKDITKSILEAGNPAQLLQSLSEQDFFWIMKKAGEEEYLPLIKLASAEQRQYIIDLEIWKKDRIDLESTLKWLTWLKDADGEDLAWWLLHEGNILAHFFLLNNIDVIVKEPDDEFEIPKEFFTCDDVIYIRVIHEEYRDAIEEIITILFREDETLTRSLIEELAGTILSESEEEMYRYRNIRIAEQGFIPFEEAVSVLSPLSSESLEKNKNLAEKFKSNEEEIAGTVPVLPLNHAGGGMLTDLLSGTEDIKFIDRIRLEFAGLCNKIIAAEGFSELEADTLLEQCRKAAGYINIALENECGGNIRQAGDVIRKNTLESVFRVGFGLALKLKWEATAWIEASWFKHRKLDMEFWGESWGMTVKGLMKQKPLFYTGHGEKEFRDFEKLSEIESARVTLKRIMVLDDLLSHLDEKYGTGQTLSIPEGIVFHSFIFTFWARRVLDLNPGFSEITARDAQTLFTKLRAEESAPPYRMKGFEEVFIRDLSEYISDLKEESREALKNTLSMLWKEFSVEYESLPASEIDTKYSRFLHIIK